MDGVIARRAKRTGMIRAHARLNGEGPRGAGAAGARPWAVEEGDPLIRPRIHGEPGRAFGLWAIRSQSSRGSVLEAAHAGFAAAGAAAPWQARAHRGIAA